ncbi:hypothetical protein J2T19_000135 [Paenibacillus tundrae]|uniref:Uncharacterized protein n=1 Tax=Paenibacillus tundrae TaxID=528187 RepID=A0ABT9W626_9BACL|nr:hypothetical protein [Paenibacillus tundrae]
MIRPNRLLVAILIVYLLAITAIIAWIYVDYASLVTNIPEVFPHVKPR